MGYSVANYYNFAELTREVVKTIELEDGTQIETVTTVIDRNKISKFDNEKIDKIMDGTLKNVYFRIYDNEEYDNLLVYYFQDDDSIKNQLDFYLRVLLHYPKTVINSYLKNYFEIVFVKEEDFSPYERENFNIPSRIYTPGKINIIDINENFEKFIEEYKCEIGLNNLSNRLNGYMLDNIHRLITLMELALWYSPIMLIFSALIYIILKIVNAKRAISQGKMKLLQFIIILYATTFMGVMCYVMLRAIFDRYVIPMTVTAFIAYFLTGLLILDYIVEIIKKIISNLSEKYSKRQNS